MLVKKEESTIERRINIADWITAIFSIFWSVWFGFFTSEVLDSKYEKIFLLEIFKHSIFMNKFLFIILNVIISIFFAYSYVKWLWNIQKLIKSHVFIQKLVFLSIPLIQSTTLLASSFCVYGIAFGIDKSLVLYGLLLTIFWPITVYFILRKS